MGETTGEGLGYVFRKTPPAPQVLSAWLLLHCVTVECILVLDGEHQARWNSRWYRWCQISTGDACERVGNKLACVEAVTSHSSLLSLAKLGAQHPREIARKDPLEAQVVDACEEGATAQTINLRVRANAVDEVH